MIMTTFEVVLLMFFAGVLGGIVNFALSRTENSTFRDVLWSIVVGLGCGFSCAIVP